MLTREHSNGDVVTTGDVNGDESNEIVEALIVRRERRHRICHNLCKKKIAMKRIYKTVFPPVRQSVHFDFRPNAGLRMARVRYIEIEICQIRVLILSYYLFLDPVLR